MGSSFYLFYMVLFTGAVLWCAFLWFSRDGDENGGERGGDPSGPDPVEREEPLE